MFLRGELKAKVESYVRHSSFPSPSQLLQIVQSSLCALPSRQTSAHFYACSALPIRSRHVYLEGWVAWGNGGHCRQALNSCPNLILRYVFSTRFNHKSLYGRDLITNTDALAMYFISMYEMFIFTGQFDSAVTYLSLHIPRLHRSTSKERNALHALATCLP